MAFRISLKTVKSKEILLIFSLWHPSSPSHAIYIVNSYIIPLLGDRGYELLQEIFVIGLSAMFFSLS